MRGLCTRRNGSKRGRWDGSTTDDGLFTQHVQPPGLPGTKASDNGAPIQTPSYGKSGRKERENISQHAKRGIINVVDSRCGPSGCTKRPCYGEEGSNKAEFHSRHAKTGMNNVWRAFGVSKGCANDHRETK